MSELKAISSGEIYNIIEYEGSCITDDLFYPKSEADKVIADLDKEIDRISEQALDTINWQAKMIRHNKYKRCRAMASLSLEKRETYRAEYEEWCLKWYKRWLELAEKFKETK